MCLKTHIKLALYKYAMIIIIIIIIINVVVVVVVVVIIIITITIRGSLSLFWCPVYTTIDETMVYVRTIILISDQFCQISLEFNYLLWLITLSPEM